MSDPLEVKVRAGETILVVDDSPDWVETCRDILTDQTYKILSANSVDKALEILKTTVVDLVLTDFNMPGKTGLELVQTINQVDMGCAVILMTAYPSVDSAIAVLKSGALDYLIKPFAPEQLLTAARNALDRSALARENQFLKAQLADANASHEIIGKSAKIQSMIVDLTRAAQMDTTVLVYGESGTGKELAARFLHRNSKRSKQHFAAINCAAIPHDLLESELFGHEAGSFTGATKARVGLFENADHGTVFLDEIGEMPLGLQAKLLRALEERKVRKVGSNKERSIDIRLICATNRNLLEMVKDKTFREDLYYRLNVITVEVPPLFERREDILMLLQYFFEKYATRQYPAPKELSPEVRAALLDYRWPGNIRELSNLAHFLIFANRSGTIQIDQLPSQFKSKSLREGDSAFSTDFKVDVGLFDQSYAEAKSKIDDAFEKIYVERNLIKYDWNISLTAEKTGMDRRTTHRLMNKFNIHKPE